MTPTKCVPSSPAELCQSCDRWAMRRPREPNHGYELVCIDASSILPAYKCPLYIPGPLRPVEFIGPMPRVMFDASQIGGAG
jgi:hypothetical protein